jgi:7,8-dihydropterin-6-yl-methyl-4-(beta-D-ribofuranosyl)aminobenzene 5'-phosphate synthase
VLCLTLRSSRTRKSGAPLNFSVSLVGKSVLFHFSKPFDEDTAMKVIVLVETMACGTELKGQFGLSFYIENNGLKILFDCGADGLFLENAEKLGVDIAAVDYLIISHGHYDHGGGLAHFLKVNDKAKIIVSKYAFNDYYFEMLSVEKYVGLDKTLENNERIIFTDQDLMLGETVKKYIGLNKALKDNERIIFVDHELTLGENMILFSDITGGKYLSSESKILKKENGKLVPDDFKHEQCLIIDDILFAGCAHTGIVNIYEKAKGIRDIKHIFGGFHLSNPVTKKMEDKTLIESIAGEFKNENVKMYTGHCTGPDAFKILQSILGDKIEEMSVRRTYYF